MLENQLYRLSVPCQYAQIRNLPFERKICKFAMRLISLSNLKLYENGKDLRRGGP